jgi:alkylated DNA repair dioxygenase AlkB
MDTNNPNLAPIDGELYLFRQFYKSAAADDLLTVLTAELAWQEEKIFVYGKWHQVPRLICWYGDADANYRYSGVLHQPQPWLKSLAALRERLQAYCCSPFNSMLGNLYRDGHDAMGYHADNEKGLGKNPIIASLSFGDSRLFKLRHRTRRDSLELILGHGDLLVMAGPLQHHWQHALPRTKQLKNPRINLTFRHIL